MKSDRHFLGLQATPTSLPFRGDPTQNVDGRTLVLFFYFPFKPHCQFPFTFSPLTFFLHARLALFSKSIRVSLCVYTKVFFRIFDFVAADTQLWLAIVRHENRTYSPTLPVFGYIYILIISHGRGRGCRGSTRGH